MLGNSVKTRIEKPKDNMWGATDHIPLAIYRMSMLFIRTILRAKSRIQDAR